MAKIKKLWDKGQTVNKLIEKFTVGDDYLLDQMLVPFDCQASIAHAQMLGKINILNKEEVNRLVDVLSEIKKLNQSGKFTILPEHEDCHTAIELYLVNKLGDLGKKIHTGRSRNDQVLTALRLYYKEKINKFMTLANRYIMSLKNLIKQYGKISFPGYTHTRKAMPTSIKVWAGAFIDSMRDNKILLKMTLELIDQSPLGSGAGYGVPLDLDREMTALKMGFKRVQKNPIYVQMSRGKFESTFLHCLTQIMFDLNKIATDIIFFSIPELAYLVIPDEFCTGSSIMPQKKNPDVLELIRAKYHKVVSMESEVKNITANLISGYNRDLQDTKAPVLKSFEITEKSFEVMTLVIGGLHVDASKCSAAMSNEVYATERVYDLVKKGIPFRDAYKTVGNQYR